MAAYAGPTKRATDETPCADTTRVAMRNLRLIGSSGTKLQEAHMLNGGLAWLIGLPSLIIIILWLTGYLR